MQKERRFMTALVRYSHGESGSGSWRRIQHLSTTPAANGGLGLFQPESKGIKDVFGEAPPKLLDGRPESDWLLTRWITSKRDTCATLVRYDNEYCDMCDKDVKSDAQHCLEFSTNDLACARLPICEEVLRRGLFLHKWVNKHGNITRTSSLQELEDTAVRILNDAETVEDDFLAARDLSREELARRTWENLPRVQVAAICAFRGDDASCDLAMLDLLEFHRELVRPIVGHIQLVLENIKRTSWIAARLLSADAEQARAAARELRSHLLKAGTSRTSFEQALVQDGRMELIEHFADRETPVLLWRDSGRYSALFLWLPPRFLANDDHVLNCESVHAQWQWHMKSARACKIKNLNAHLIVRSWLSCFGELPEAEKLLEDMKHIAQDVRRRTLMSTSDVGIAKGRRMDAIYLERFNLTPQDVAAFVRPTPRHQTR